MDKVLITGGAGFIGTNLVHKLLSYGYEIIIIDDLSSGYKKNIHKNIIFVEGSIDDDKALSECFKYNPKYVVHLAALFANQNSVDHPEKDLIINGLGTLKIFNFSKNSGVKKVLYASSSCVYGNKEVMIENDINFNLDTPYAITKLLGENYAKFWSVYHELDIATVRLFNVYGPGDFPGSYRSVIPNFIKLAIEGKPLVITGTGQETRDFCHVDDTVNGIIKVLINKTNSGDIFNIASGIKTPILKIADIINLYFKNNSKITFKKQRYWDHVIHRQANIDKISSLVGYYPKVNLEEGIKNTCDWLSKNI